MGKYLDMLKRLDVKADDGEKSELREQRFTNPSSNEVSHNRSGDLIRLSRFFRPLDELERRRPEHVEPGRWHQAVEDGRRTAVHSAPDLPAPSSLRLHWLDLAFAGLSRRGAHAGCSIT